MIKKKIEITNKLGLHARASAKLTQTANQFTAAVWVARDSRRVNAKSIMGVMMLAAGMGAVIEIEADGVDELEAMAALETLFNEKFGEGE